jgi:murein DD-endopeptidase MepM/ murein hydrolase activator NlpD
MLGILVILLSISSCNSTIPTASVTASLAALLLTPTLEHPNPPASTKIPTSFPPPPSTLPSLTPTPLPSLPCSPELCVYPGHFWLERPISPENVDSIDPTYRYGSTQEGARPTHHGVEFVNEEGTPVLAAADGLVIVAGNDFQETYADFPFYYGNLVVIQHNFPQYGQPVFSLYGHLSVVQAEVGKMVKAGDPIGAVGYTGAAEWSHLHFEVRVGQNRYLDTRNPELWLQPHENGQGTPNDAIPNEATPNGAALNGAIAGRILDEFGTSIYIPNVVIEHLGQDGEVIIETVYVETYADFSVNGDDEWGENFVIGDLPPGKYRVTFVARGLQTWDVEVYPGNLTLLTFNAGNP